MPKFKSFATLLNRGRRRSGAIVSTGSTNRLASTTIEDLIRKCAPLSTAVGLISRTIAGLPVKADDPRVQELLANPNKYQTRSEFMATVCEAMVGYGAAVIAKQNSVGGGIANLAVYRPTDLVITENPLQIQAINMQNPLPMSRYIIIRDGASFGMLPTSRTELVRTEAQQYIALSQMALDSFQRGSISSYWLKFLPGTGRDNMKDAIEAVTKSFTGSEATRRGAVGGAEGVDITSVKPVLLSDQDSNATISSIISRIAAAFSVPPHMLGHGDGSLKFSNYSQSILNFHRGLTPIITQIEESLTKGLESRIEIDSSRLLAGDLETQARVATQLAGRPVMSVNEARMSVMNLGPGEGEGLDEVADVSSSPDLDDRRGERSDLSEDEQ